MSTPDPSFFRIFRRSRYYRGPADDDDSSEAQEARLDRERFATAALALCLKYDEPFRRAFWEKICRVKDDSEEMPPISAQDIHLEPPRWADLRLVSDTPAGRYMWVVEVKAGAKLAAIQTPTDEQFELPKIGYGALYHESESPRNTRMRYIVLGAKENLTLPQTHSKFLIHLSQRRWSDVAICPASPLVQDFFDTLGALTIQPFAMNKAKSAPSVTGGLARIGDAHDILMNVYEWLGVKRGQRKLEVYPESGGSVVGIYVKRNSIPSPTAGELATVSDSEDLLAWIGYFAGSDDSIKRSVWIYFKTPKRRDEVMAKTKIRFPEVQAQTDGAYSCMIVKAAPDGTNDLPWFLSVFEASGVKPTPIK